MDLVVARALRRIRQWDLSAKTGISQGKISLIENGWVKPSEEEKKKIAKVLGCKVGDIFPRTQETYKRTMR